MGKKKNRQNSNCGVVDQSESSDATVISKSDSKNICPHINKSVDTNGLRKTFRGNGHISNRECTDCKKSGVSTSFEDICFCLRCGICCCGPEINNHSLNHFQKPHSDSHCLVVKLDNLNVWCHECRLEIPADSLQKLHTCIDFIKQLRDKFVETPTKIINNIENVSDQNAAKIPDGSLKNNLLTISSKNLSLVKNNKIKGLTNLGNTCFFNSVLQCLAQTPGLMSALKEMQIPGKKFTLPVSNDKPIVGELDKAGPVSDNLLELLMFMTDYNNSNTVINPRKLFSILCKKCPMFEGFDQHDAHELLRHLLDLVRVEDLRRYQRVILQINGLSTKVNPQVVTEEKRKWFKELNKQISDEMPICPDEIFKGVLVSQLQCQTCFHTSDCLESFLDLSLPVTSEKPVPPVVTRRKNQWASKNDADEPPPIDDSSSYQPSKAALSKKKKRMIKKCSAQNKKKKNLDEEGQESSDADVEDNGENYSVKTKAELLESGYCSEKLSSSRTSPTADTQNKVNESATASAPTLTDVTNEFSNLRIDNLTQSEKLCPLSQTSESGLGSSIVSIQDSSVSILGTSDHTQSMDSCDSVKGNPSSTSRDISIESLQEIGLPSPRDESFSSDHEDSQLKYSCADSLLDESYVNPIYDKTLSLSKAPDENKYSYIDKIHDNFNSLDFCKTVVLDINNKCNNNNGLPNNDYQSNLENIKVARSSPVEISRNQSLDGDLLSLSLESYKTECYLDKQKLQNMNVDNLVDSSYEKKLRTFTSECNAENSDEQVGHGETKNTNKTDLVLANGEDFATTGKPNNISVNENKTEEAFESDYDKRNKAIESSGNENEYELSEDVNPEFYKNRHITLAPRYQCSENECSILSCLNNFTAIEMMAGNNKVSCQACTEKQNRASKEKEAKTVYRVSTKRLLINSPPTVLILHLKRFQVQRFSFKKLNCHVEFPSVLDLAPFCSKSVQQQLAPDQTKILYSLFGVVAHSGTLRGGHYIAYVKVRDGNCEEGKPSAGTWYYVSDSHTREVTEQNVLSSQAYLLFYERFL